MPDPSRGGRESLLGSLSALGGTLVATVQTRLALLALDLEEERLRLFSQLALTVAAAFCIGLSILLGTAAVVVVFWSTHRLLVLTSLAVLFLAVGTVALTRAWRLSRTRPPLFASSRAELEADRRHFSQPT